MVFHLATLGFLVFSSLFNGVGCSRKWRQKSFHDVLLFSVPESGNEGYFPGLSILLKGPLISHLTSAPLPLALAHSYCLALPSDASSCLDSVPHKPGFELVYKLHRCHIPIIARSHLLSQVSSPILQCPCSLPILAYVACGVCLLADGCCNLGRH